jgi:hypothetical protein
MKIENDDFLLAALATGNGEEFEPVQIQKLLFLIDKRLGPQTDGPRFNFEAYDYGPFDSGIYRLLGMLAAQEKVQILKEPAIRWQKYRPTPSGLKRGEEVLCQFDPETVSYMRKLSEFVRKLPFAELVGAIYKAYPEMKVNSVFRGV